MSRSGVQDPTIGARIVERLEWWATRDSNPDGLLHTPLKRARLPVPPAAQLSRLILPGGRSLRHRQKRRDGGPVARGCRDAQRPRCQPLPERRPANAFRVPGVDLAADDRERLLVRDGLEVVAET